MQHLIAQICNKSQSAGSYFTVFQRMKRGRFSFLNPESNAVRLVLPARSVDLADISKDLADISIDLAHAGVRGILTGYLGLMRSNS